MNQLVEVMSGKVATTSTIIAVQFEKRHDHVLATIDNLKKDLPNFGEMFLETDIPDSVGRSRRSYIMGRDGFSLVAMGFTGAKALSFKLDFINAFNQMEELIKEQHRPKSQLELIKMTATEMIKTNERIDTLEYQVNNQMTLDYGQQQALLNQKNIRVEQLWNRVDFSHTVYDTKKKVHARAWRDLKNAFGASSYKDIRKKDFEEAVAFIKHWRPAMIGG